MHTNNSKQSHDRVMATNKGRRGGERREERRERSCGKMGGEEEDRESKIKKIIGKWDREGDR